MKKLIISVLLISAMLLTAACGRTPSQPENTDPVTTDTNMQETDTALNSDSETESEMQETESVPGDDMSKHEFDYDDTIKPEKTVEPGDTVYESSSLAVRFVKLGYKLAPAGQDAYKTAVFDLENKTSEDLTYLVGNGDDSLFRTIEADSVLRIEQDVVYEELLNNYHLILQQKGLADGEEGENAEVAFIIDQEREYVKNVYEDDNIRLDFVGFRHSDFNEEYRATFLITPKTEESMKIQVTKVDCLGYAFPDNNTFYNSFLDADGYYPGFALYTGEHDISLYQYYGIELPFSPDDRIKTGDDVPFTVHLFYVLESDIDSLKDVSFDVDLTVSDWENNYIPA